jgi:hypothetical protein
MELSDAELETKNGRAVAPKYFEFGLDQETADISFKELARQTHHQIARPLTQFSLFHLFLKNHFEDQSGQKFATNGSNKLQVTHLQSRFQQDLERFTRYFEEWLREMAQSRVSFSPINLDVNGHDILNLVKNSPEQSSGIFGLFSTKSLEHYIASLNRAEQERQYDALADSEKKLLAVFAHATDNIIKKRINL